MFRVFKILLIIILIVIIGNLLFDFLDELTLFLDEVPVWVWVVSMIVLLAIFFEDEKKTIVPVNIDIREQLKRKNKKANLFRKLGNLLFKLVRIIVIICVAFIGVFYLVKYVGVDWFTGIYEDSLSFYEKTPWYFLVIGSIIIIFFGSAFIAGILEGINETEMHKEEELYRVPDYKNKLSKEDIATLKEEFASYRKHYKQYEINKNTVFLKHPKWNFVFPEQKENLKDGYFQCTILTEKHFHDWLEGESFNSIEHPSCF